MTRFSKTIFTIKYNRFRIKEVRAKWSIKAKINGAKMDNLVKFTSLRRLNLKERIYL